MEMYIGKQNIRKLAKVECFDNTNDDYITFETCNDDTAGKNEISSGNVGEKWINESGKFKDTHLWWNIKQEIRNWIIGVQQLWNDEYNDWRIYIEDVKFLLKAQMGQVMEVLVGI